MKKVRKHIVSHIIRNPTDPISITIIGMGGTGTRLISELVRMNIMLLKLGHIGLDVSVIDGDTISDSNIGKQFYYADDIGKHKAQVVIDRINRNFGYNWHFVNDFLKLHQMILDERRTNMPYSNITVMCVDNIEARFKTLEIIQDRFRTSSYHDHTKELYLIDSGNSFNKGQVICGTINDIPQKKSKEYISVKKMKDVFKVFGEKKMKLAVTDEDSGASCSTFEALERQDPFINSTIAMLTAKLIWNIIRDGELSIHGYFVNLEDPVPITSLQV